MRRVLICLIVVVGIGLLLPGWFMILRRPALVEPIPPGDQEIAWFHVATSVSAWERFVTGVHRVGRGWSGFRVDDSRAFPDATTATPEVTISVDGRPGRLHIRWYKLSKNTSASDWLKRLAERSPPPLAVIGGGSSDRAYDLARAMQRETSWRGERPLLFITTATASRIIDPDQAGDIELMQVYPDRSFRMAFTNEQIARAVVEFVWSQSDLRPYGDVTAAASIFPIPNTPFAAAALYAAQTEYSSPSVWALEWDDDPNSYDLAKQFRHVLHEGLVGTVSVRETQLIPFSIGGQFAPNAWEAQAAERLSASLANARNERQLLVLPTLAAPARRILRFIVGSLPLIGQNLVVVTGDTINLNNVYRDADIGWNIRSIPVPLVFFSHQNPVDWDWPAPEELSEQLSESNGLARSQFAQATPDQFAPPTATDETLLHCDMVRLICRAAFGVDPENSPGLIGSADELRRRLMDARPAVFAENGDRRAGRGEFVCVVRPQFTNAGGTTVSQIASTATLEVWTRNGPEWRRVKRLNIDHGRGRRGNH